MIDRRRAGRGRERPTWDGQVLDAGLQAERTAMAWQRTALGVGGFSALLLHAAGDRVGSRLPGLAGLVLALVLLGAGERRYLSSVHDVLVGRSPAAPGALRLVAGSVVVLCLAALTLLALLG